jgi:CHAT domain-containing protein/tetratricopeptide (TPR) repeat protein
MSRSCRDEVEIGLPTRLAALLLLSLLLFPAFLEAQSTAEDLLVQAEARYKANDNEGSRRLLESALEAAVNEHNLPIEAQARGLVLYLNGEYAAAEIQLKAAADMFKTLGNKPHEATTQSTLGSTYYWMGKSEDALSHYEAALALYQSLDDGYNIVRLHYNLVFATSGSVRMEHIQQGLELSRKLGLRNMEAVLLETWAQQDFDADDYKPAFDRLEKARTILEELGNKEDLAGVLTSIGRLYRAHGHPEEALHYYQRSLELQQALGSKPGIIQSLNSIHVALDLMGRSSEALEYEEQALRIARETGSPMLIKAMLEGVASSYNDMNQYDKALQLLEEAAKIPPPSFITLQQLAIVRSNLGQFDAALDASNLALQLGSNSNEQIRSMLGFRAQFLWKLGRSSEALTDIGTALDSFEQARRELIPTDFLKQGFAERYRDLQALAIHIYTDSGRDLEALATAESARGRAFLDLLETKSLAKKVEAFSEQAASRPMLPVRGELAGTSNNNKLESQGVASAASVEDLIALARRLNSTILSYWIDQTSTMIWAIAPDGRVSTARTQTGEKTLTKWIDETLQPAQANPVRGRDGTIELPSRAGDTILTSRTRPQAWRQLYDALIRPVRSKLSVKSKRLTIIPNGPLFRLSFAALVDEKGRYLLEDFSLHYAPAGGVLNYTQTTKRKTANLPDHYLLVANPAGMPVTPEGKPLPRLPGSDEEVRRIAQLLPAREVSLLRGSGADETSVRKAMTSAKVIHLATHGIVRNEDPLGSYLAFGQTNNQAESDGRLTAEEVYGLNLDADLVVLSACRSGTGQITGDGVAGLARAFLYAGAASVVSTLWDVADEPASQLVADFYRTLSRTHYRDKSEALRAAQLNLLHALRSGDVHVDTPFGKLSLPENPMLWAGFILVGEP